MLREKELLEEFGDRGTAWNVAGIWLPPQGYGKKKKRKKFNLAEAAASGVNGLYKGVEDRFPHKCPWCGYRAYIGGGPKDIECTNWKSNCPYGTGDG